MKTLHIDTGMTEYRLGSGVLRFNPADPNLYARFLDALDRLQQLEARLTETPPDTSGTAVLQLLRETDREAKAQLNRVFGPENDFDALLGGVNLLAVGSNGQRVITNLLTALEPVLTQGAKACADARAQEAVAQARQRRAKQGTGT